MTQQAATVTRRWRFAAAAFLMQLCLGVIYAWSIFRGPLASLHGWSKAQTIAPYRYSLLFFTLGMIVAGFWQDRKGPRLVATAGGLLLGAGCLLAAFAGGTVEGLILSYGVVAGTGVGFAYVTPIATCVKWFPDHRGAIAGFAVMGFGAGPLVFGPLLERLLGSDPSRYAETVPRTFLVIAAIFALFVVGAAQVYRVPPTGWRPSGWSPPAAGGAHKENFRPGDALRTWQFWALWLVYCGGASIGLVAIGEAAPFLGEAGKQGALMSAGAALGVMSVFNGLGRLFWGSVSDRLSRNRTTALMFVIYVVACQAVLRGGTGFSQALAGLSLVGFAYGGFLALMPSFTAEYFGAKSLGANYGLLFTAWGLSGYFVPGFFAPLLDRARTAGAMAEGYDRVFSTLAMLAAAGAAGALVLRRPR